jgi:hypothetical protein
MTVSAATSDLQLNLQRLISDFSAALAKDPVASSRYANPDPMAERVAQGVALAHCVARKNFRSVVTSGFLLSQLELIRIGALKFDAANPTTEILLGTADDVFTYAGPCRYQKPGLPLGVGLLFKVEVERKRTDRMVATPFDSGAVRHRLHPSDSLPDQVTFVRQHELPVPEYRQLLQRYLTAFFAHPCNYTHPAREFGVTL